MAKVFVEKGESAKTADRTELTNLLAYELSLEDESPASLSVLRFRLRAHGDVLRGPVTEITSRGPRGNEAVTTRAEMRYVVSGSPGP